MLARHGLPYDWFTGPRRFADSDHVGAACSPQIERILADTAEGYPLRAPSLPHVNPIGAEPQLRSGLQDPAPTHALGKLLEARTTGKPFTITGLDWPTRVGTGLRDYIHVWDLAEGHVKAREAFDTVVLGRPGPRRDQPRHRPVRELVDAFRADASDLDVREAPPRPGDVVGCCTRRTKAASALGWTAERSVHDGVRDALARLDRRPKVLGY